MSSQNNTAIDRCQTSNEIFTDELLAPYNASYTFCQEAAERCVDPALGAANITRALVTDVRASTNVTLAPRSMYYFYSQSFAGGDDRLVSCLTQNGLENVTMFWAPGQPVRDAAAVTDDTSELANAAPASFRRPKRSSGSLTHLLPFLLAFVFVLQHLVGVASASVPAPLLQRRATSCAKYEPQSAPYITTLVLRRLSDGADCANQPRCILQTFGKRLAAGGGLSYQLIGADSRELSVEFDATRLIENSFNVSSVVRYSESSRRSATAPLIAIQSNSKQQQFVQASQMADVYEGNFTECADGNPIPARLFIPTASWTYSLVNTNE